MDQAQNIKCDKCPQSFPKSDALVAHLIQNHTRYQQQERTRNTLDNEVWDCSFCGLNFRGNEAWDSHACNAHPYSSSQQQVRGTNKSQELCKRGANCHFHKTGRCWFTHVQNVENQAQSQVTRTNTGKTNMWCAFQDRCTKRQACVYKHMDKERDFVQNLFRGMGV